MMAFPIYVAGSLVCYLIGMQLQLSELKLLSFRYNYRPQLPQLVTVIAALALIALTVTDICRAHVDGRAVGIVALALLVYVLFECSLTYFSPKRLSVSLTCRLLVIALLAWAFHSARLQLLLPCVLAGIYLRNSPFGNVPHGKPMFLAYYMRRKPMNAVVREDNDYMASDPAEETNAKLYNVADYGILPDTSEDLIDKVQLLIDKVGSMGGGIIYFPRGRYLFNCQGKRSFLQINHSHIILEGQCDEQGRLLTELVNCGTTVNGSRNPWLSPAFITTGEALQQSNMFWGLDFRKPEHIRQESSSLSDPGSDGTILTPSFATHVTASAQEADCLLSVADSSAVGKYILLGLYNTTPEGKLVKELLGVDELRPEWLTARRAGPEQAPSFQWLVEVVAKPDANTIELAFPLLRDCPMDCEPAVFNVEMLEDVHIRHLRISSRWNGMFRHHGFPLYYSVPTTQEMDYGWNAINLRRAAHSSIENVEIHNFTNPIYVQDSHQCSVNRVAISGYDGHQGLKVYCHTSACTFSNIDFYCHYADMMGGEGNAYDNVFSRVRYLNPTFNPVDFDFHGFPEGPMSPPAYNLFTSIEGFRSIKGAGAVHNLPACAAKNRWETIVSEGERRGDSLYYAMNYRVRSFTEKYVTALGFTVVMMLKRRNHSLAFLRQTFRNKLADIESMSIPRHLHKQFFPQSYVEDITTTAVG